MSSAVRTPSRRSTRTWLLATGRVSGRSTYVSTVYIIYAFLLTGNNLRFCALWRSRRTMTFAVLTSSSSWSPSSSSPFLIAFRRRARPSSRTGRRRSKVWYLYDCMVLLVGVLGTKIVVTLLSHHCLILHAYDDMNICAVYTLRDPAPENIGMHINPFASTQQIRPLALHLFASIVSKDRIEEYEGRTSYTIRLILRYHSADTLPSCTFDTSAASQVGDHYNWV